MVSPLTVPVASAAAAVHTGEFTSVSSCTPAVPLALGRVVVGQQGRCTYHGLVSFNVGTLPLGVRIVAASLHLARLVRLRWWRLDIARFRLRRQL